MKSKEDLCNLIDKSTITLIGYTFQDEKKKDELISNFNYVEIKEIDSSFSFKSFLRNEKLKHILDGTEYSNSNYILLDINNIKPPYDGVYKWDKSSFIRKFLEDLRVLISTENPDYKFILTTTLNKSGINSEGDDINNFKGGSGPIYISDLVIVIKEDIVQVIKNRNGIDGDYIIYNIKQTVEI